MTEAVSESQRLARRSDTLTRCVECRWRISVIVRAAGDCWRTPFR